MTAITPLAPTRVGPRAGAAPLQSALAMAIYRALALSPVLSPGRGLRARLRAGLRGASLETCMIWSLISLSSATLVLMMFGGGAS